MGPQRSHRFPLPYSQPYDEGIEVERSREQAQSEAEVQSSMAGSKQNILRVWRPDHFWPKQGETSC
jgi:hypothetical protein